MAVIIGCAFIKPKTWNPACADATIVGIMQSLNHSLVARKRNASEIVFTKPEISPGQKCSTTSRCSTAAWIAIAAGIALMAGIALFNTGGLPHNTLMDLVAGLIGATTMVLPGISGSYMLLVLDQYDRVIGAVHDRDFRIIIPVGIGAVMGVVVLSNALKYLLHHYKTVTIGFLLGMLLGSVIGLWPFGRQPGDKLLDDRPPADLRAFAAKHGIPGMKGADDAALQTLIVENWKDRTVGDYAPAAIATSALILVAGFVATFALARQRRR